MAGHPGSGKSTVAHALGRRLGWPVLDKDTIKSTLMDASPPGIDLAALGLDLDLVAYELLHALVVDLLVQQELSMILDTPALRPAVVRRMLDLVDSSGATLKVLLCHADLQTRNERLLQRSARSSHRTTHAVDTDIQKHFGHLPPDTRVLHTDQPLDDLIAEVMAYIQG